jgi:hypothetical protein
VRQQVDVVGAEDELVRIAGIALGIDERFGAAAGTLVLHDDRLTHQVVLGDDRLDGAGEVVSPATGARGNDEFHRTFRGPLRKGTGA